jgi:DNA-binding transcriptional LysR family regulator
VVVLAAKHPLAKQSRIKIKDLKPLFFVAMSETTHPGSRAWLTAVCQQAGFTPRILQDVEFESDLLSFVAEDLGVALAREQIKHLAHAGVVFRALAQPVKADYWIAWHQENRSKALHQYIEIVKTKAAVFTAFT